MDRFTEHLKYDVKYTIGDTIKPYGRVAAILWLGERYYLCLDKNNVTSLIPAMGLRKDNA